MKKIVLLLAITLGVMGMSQQSYAQGKLQDWKELKEFHGVMSQTFQPSEEGNLDPIKTRIGEMVQKAKTVQSSTIPASFNNENVKTAVAQLVTGSEKLEASIKAGASDKKITKSLSKLHDTFHKIVGLCSEIEGEGHGHGEGEHNHSHGEGEHNHQH